MKVIVRNLQDNETKEFHLMRVGSQWACVKSGRVFYWLPRSIRKPAIGMELVHEHKHWIVK